MFYTGGSGISAVDAILISETIAYGCTGIMTALFSNDLAVNHVYKSCMATNHLSFIYVCGGQRKGPACSWCDYS